MLKKYDDSEDRNMNAQRSFSKREKNGGSHLQNSEKNDLHYNRRYSGKFSGTLAMILAMILMVSPVTAQGAQDLYRRSGDESGNDVLLDHDGTTGEEASEEEETDTGIYGQAEDENETQAITADTAYPETEESAENTENTEDTEDTEENNDTENSDTENNLDTEDTAEQTDVAPSEADPEEVTDAGAESDPAAAGDSAPAAEEAPAGETAAEEYDNSSTGEDDGTAAIASTEESAGASETAWTEEASASETTPAAENASASETPAAETAPAAESAAASETASAGETAASEAAAADDTSLSAVISAAEEELSEDSAAKKEDGVVRVHLAGEPGDPVPSETMDTDTASLLKLISEGLVALDENGNPVPGCAQEWTVSDDGLKWVFRLRKDLCWADGEPMNAKDFEKMFRRIADPATEALYGHDLMKNIAGYEDVLNGDTEALQAYAKDDRTFVVKLTTPDPSFARICASWTLLPVREQIEKDSPELNWENVTGNGPYLIASGNLEDAASSSGTGQQGYILKKNPYYNNEQEPFEEVHWIVDGDVNKEYSDLLNGDFDAVSTLPQEEGVTKAQDMPSNQNVSGIQDTAAAAVQNDSAALDTTDVSDSRTTPDTIGILFNCGQEALQDSRVRRALSMAVDRQYIASEILGGVYEPSSDQDFYENILGTVQSGNPEEAGQDRIDTENSETGSMSAQLPDNRLGSAQDYMLAMEQSEAQDTGHEEDQFEEAKELLKEAGYEDGEDFPVLVCLADENGSAVRIAEYIASRWKELGIELKIEKTSAKDLAQEKEKGLFDLICGNILLPSDHTAGELEKYTTDHKENTSGFSSEEYDGLIEEAMQTPEETKYQEKMEEAVEVLSNETPAAPLASKSVSWLRQDGMDGIVCDASGCWQLWDTEKSKNKGILETETADVEMVSETGSSAVVKNDNAEESAPAVAKNSNTEGSAPAVVKNSNTEESASAVVKNNNTEDAASVTRSNDSRETAAPAGLKNYTSRAVSALMKIFTPKDGSAPANAAGIRTKSAGEKETAEFKPEQGSFMDRMFHSDSYYQKVDRSAWLTSQAYVLDGASADARRIVSLPKYTGIRLTGIGKTGYVRISENGRFYYLEADKVTTNRTALNGIRNTEERQAEQLAIHSMSMHPVKKRELMKRAAGIKEDTEEILARIAFREALKTQTRNPNWDGPVLSRSNGSVHGPSGKETYYNLNMSGVVSIMRGMGNNDEYWVRDDGCKMLGDYIMCAANLSVHPRGSLVESSLGTCIVCDTGGFASGNANQLDIAVTW